jgi:hypothetical protein
MPFFTTLFGSVSSMILYVCFNQSLALSFLLFPCLFLVSNKR